MGDYALIKGGKVENVIVADDAFIAECGAQLALGGAWLKLEAAHNVNGQRPGPGWRYSAATKKFSRPAGGA